jgi:hypothetical protein
LSRLLTAARVVLPLLALIVPAFAQSPTASPKPEELKADVAVKILFRNPAQEILLVFDDRRQAWEVPGMFHQGPVTLMNLIDAVARDVGITYENCRLGGVFTYHNPQTGATIVRPYYTARFHRYLDGNGFKDGDKTKWFTLSEAKKVIPYPASVRIVEKLLREPAQVWGGAFEEYGYTSPMTDRSSVKFRIIEDFYRLK